jgi:SAM-dependent methyltransferase
LRFAALAARSLAATGIAVLLRGPGQRFGVFGRSVGIRALLAGERRIGKDLVLTPVHIVRYWEFPFALRHVPAKAATCLDVGSPRLFSLYVARRSRGTRIRVINPDRLDVAATTTLVRVLGLHNVELEELAVADLAGDTRRYDAIWSISVVEHIPGDGDRGAIRQLYEALAPGGRLLVTVPVDRRAWDEHREVDTYRLGLPRGPQGYFFQHWYDEEAIRDRLLGDIVAAGGQIRTEWFGERQAGRFAAYEQEWIRRGDALTVDDPLEITRGYRTFERWADMPGQGICGIAVARPI